MKQHILLLASLAALAVAAPAPPLEADTCEGKTPTKTILPGDIPTGLLPPAIDELPPRPDVKCDGGIKLDGDCVCPAGTIRIEGGCTKNDSSKNNSTKIDNTKNESIKNENTEADDEC